MLLDVGIMESAKRQVAVDDDIVAVVWTNSSCAFFDKVAIIQQKC